MYTFRNVFDSSKFCFSQTTFILKCVHIYLIGFLFLSFKPSSFFIAVDLSRVSLHELSVLESLYMFSRDIHWILRFYTHKTERQKSLHYGKLTIILIQGDVIVVPNYREL